MVPVGTEDDVPAPVVVVVMDLCAKILFALARVVVANVPSPVACPPVPISLRYFVWNLAMAVLVLIFVFQVPARENAVQAADEVQTLIMNQKNCGLALAELKDLLKQFPDSAQLWHWQGVCYFQNEEYGPAKQSFEKSLALNSDNQPAKT